MLKPGSLEWRGLPVDRALRDASPNVAHALEKALAGEDLGFTTRTSGLRGGSWRSPRRWF